MSDFAKEIIPVNLEDEMKQSYLDYAMSVIIGRALPDVRDGLKPVHRRVLYAMSVLSNDWNKPYKKSARVVGDCFVKGALVHTELGLKTIESIEVGEKVLLPDGGLSEVVEAFHNPPSEVVDINLSNGNSLTVTLGQLFRVLKDDLSIDWEKAENLHGKRILATNSRCLGDDVSNNNDKTDLAYIIGLLVAEGSLADRGRTRRVTINMVDTEALEFLSQYCLAHNIKVSWREVTPKNPEHSLQHCVRFTGLDEAYDACDPTCANKIVPDWVLHDRSLFAAFIAGFTDGDGHLRLKESKREITLTSASAKLLTQIQTMLADFGIHSYYTCEDFSDKNYGDNYLPRYNLWITGENASRFSRFTLDYLKTSRKRAVAIEMNAWNSSHANVLSEFIPSESIFNELSKHHLGGGWYQDKNGNKFRAGIKYPTGSKIRYSSDLFSKNISYSQLEQWGIINKLERIGSPLAEKLTHLMNTYSVLTVNEVIKQTELVETYDIQIADESHEFLVQGCAVHNCIGKYHPHGDTAVYDTMVRMAQPFSMRNMLIDGQGNFGCFTGDTKIKLLDGSEKSFSQLAGLAKGEIFKVSSFDINLNKTVQGDGRDSRITRKDAELIELTLGNGKKIRCTPDHLFLIKNENGTAYKEAKYLKPEHELMPAYDGAMAVKEGLCDSGMWQPNQLFHHHITNIEKLTETADVYDITVDEYHNFLLADGVLVHNSVDGDSPAAMRYTEVRMAKISHEILADLDKETVDFVSNYDESESEPSVMPTRIPTLLINGSSGIAVGMATNIPPHNLNEVVSGCLALMEQPEMTIEDLMQYIPGPDFPTAAFINGSLGIYDAYSTGRGKVHLRAKAHFEPFGQNDNREAIIVTELPYQVNKARLLEKIGEMHKDGKIYGISALRDESDKDGMRMVIELKRGEVADVILNNLYKQTQLQTVFGINMVAILDGRPYCMNLKEILSAFINHRREVVTRRTLYLLRKAREKAHTLEGLGIALSNIDKMITLIKASNSPAEARESLLGRDWAVGLVAGLLADADVTRSRPEELPEGFGINGELYKISPAQAQAILELRLHRLTGLEQDKIIAEFKKLLDEIDEYLLIIGSDIRLMEIIKEELEAIKEEYSDPRRTVILKDRLSLATEDLITEEDRVVTMSHEGYVKSQPLTDYKAQKRGGRGKMAAATKQEDFVDKLIIANTHDTILCFSSSGKVYGLKVYTLPVASRTSRGTPFVNILPLEKGEQINAMLTVREFSEDKFIFMATANGTVKKTPLKQFERQPVNGKIAIDLRDDNSLVGVAVTDGQQNVLLFSSNGKVICFNETDVRSMGRTAAGVRGIRLKEGQKIISLIISAEGTVLNITENGFGKRTLIEKFNCQKRGGQGVIAIQTSERNGAVIGAVLVNDTDEIMLITDGGTLVRTRVAEISVVGRNAQGVTVIRPDSGEKVVGVGRIEGLPTKEVEAMLRGVYFPYPTELSLCRHYEQMIKAKAEDCLNDAQKMEALENEYRAIKSNKSENIEENDNTDSDITSEPSVSDE